MKVKTILKTTFLFAIFFVHIGLKNTNRVQAQTSEIKIGYVNPQAILASMPEMKAVQQRLQNFTTRKQQELYDKEQAFQTEVVAYQQKIGVISTEAQRQEEERLGQLQAELVQAQRDAEGELQAKRNELVGPLLEQIGAAIDTIASSMQLTYVLNTTTSTGDLVILYASEEYQQKYDITEQVMEAFGNVLSKTFFYFTERLLFFI